MKKTHSKLAITATTALVVLGFATQKSEAAGGDRLISYAHALENTVDKLNVEIREHYSHTRIYRHMLSDTAHLRAEAEHIDQLAHNPYTSIIHLRTDIIEVDKHVHHLHDLIDGAENGRYGHVHGDTRHVHSLMEYMERLVHSMEVEVANIQRMQRDPHHGHHGHGSRHDSHGGHRDNYNSRTDPRNINNYMGNQWNRNSTHVEPQVQRTIRVDPRGFFNLFRGR
ncbi:hypothetical protein VSU19_20785 [Verrucomicrobiales bacterium BCK34]|nr:hypothetical protein [Verrucomicrobiales bacterium BCK34]